MKKRLSLVLASIALVVGGSYYMSGKVIQKAYYKSVAQFNQRSDIKINLVSYKRGFFHSNAKLEVLVPMASTSDLETLALNQHITHGPIMAVNTLNGLRVKVAASTIKSTFADHVQQKLNHFTNNAQAFSFTTVIGFDNQANSWFKLPPTDQSVKSKPSIAWATITGEIAHDLNFSTYQGQINLPKITVNSDNSTLSVADVTVTLDAGDQQQGYFNNNTQHIKTISYSKQDKELLKLKDLTIRLDFSMDAKQISNLLLAINVQEADILDQHFAAQVAKLAINNIKPSSLPSAKLLNQMSPKSILEIAQVLTAPTETTMQLQLPKNFTESLVSYISYELYCSSVMGRFDRRPEDTVRADINNSITNLVQMALRQKLFIDQGQFYALNYDGMSNQKSG